MKKIFCSLFIISILSVYSIVIKAQNASTTQKNSSPEITSQELGKHIQYLASDNLEGRGTGTRGLDSAAEYIRKEFFRYGLKPSGEKNSYFQTFEVVTGMELAGGNSIMGAIGGKRMSFVVQKDFIPLSFTSNGSVSGEIVFAGYGISAPKLKYNDYENTDVKNKIVLIFSGHPEEDNPHSEFVSFAKLRSKALYAREAGAVGLLIVRPDTAEKELYKLKYDNSPSQAGIICINISRETADKILAKSKTKVASLYNELQKTKKPLSKTFKNLSILIAADVHAVKKNTSNVIGVIPGTDPNLKNQFIIVGAHYDHLGWGQDGSLYRGKEPMIHNGADDNASGTAAMLELAQYFTSKSKEIKHSMIFMAFTAEEMGTLGSSYYVAHPGIPLDKTVAMINLDMVGRLVDSTKELNVQGVGTSPDWKEIANSADKAYNLKLKFIDDGQGPSDHALFYLKDIPVLFLFTGLHSDYHKPSDDYEKINSTGEEAVTKFTADIISMLDARTEKLVFTKVKKSEAEQQARAFNVYVGTIPDYGAQEKGFKISGVSEGSPAEKAGLKAGDIITKFGETGIQSIYDYMGALGMHKPGEDVKVTVKRGNEEKVLTVHLEKK